MHFHPVGNQPLFEYAAEIDRDAQGRVSVRPLYPLDIQFDEDTSAALFELAFPLAPSDNELLLRDRTFSITYTTILATEQEEPLYATIHYKPCESGYNLQVIVSKFYHHHIFHWAVIHFDEVGLLAKFHKLTFKPSTYDIVVEQISSNQSVQNGFSPFCEIGEHNKFFLKNFPPYYIATLISMLFIDTRIVVVSSSFSFLSKVVLSISSLFYPFDLHIPFCPLLPYTRFDLLDRPGPYIIGIHTSMVDKLTAKQIPYLLFNADEPYLCPNKCSLFDDSLKPKISEFNEQILSVCSRSQPAFPAESIQMEIRNFIRNVLTTVLATPDVFRFVYDEYQIKKGMPATTPSVLLCRSTVMEEFMRSSQSTDPATEEARFSFWPQGTSTERGGRQRSSKTFSMIKLDRNSALPSPIAEVKKEKKHSFFGRKK